MKKIIIISCLIILIFLGIIISLNLFTNNKLTDENIYEYSSNENVNNYSINQIITNSIDNTTINTTNTLYNTVNSYIPNEKLNNTQNTLSIDNSQISNDENKVTIKTVEDSITKSSIILSITDNNEIKYTWGKYYIIQEKIDNNWKNVPPIIDPIFNDLAYRLDENNNFLQRINWSKYYGELSSGTYRIVKPIYNTEINEYINFYSNEFIIE